MNNTYRSLPVIIACLNFYFSNRPKQKEHRKQFCNYDAQSTRLLQICYHFTLEKRQTFLLGFQSLALLIIVAELCFHTRINLYSTIDNEFHLDGIRFDSTRAVKHYDLLKWINDETHRRVGFKPFYTIAEHLPQDPSITGVNGPIDAAWHDNFYRQIIVTTLGVADENHQPFVTDEILRVMDARRDGFDSPYNVVNYLNNHDQERVMYLLGATAKVFDDAAFRRNKLGAGLLLTSPGIPMLWMGEEFGHAAQKSEKRQPLDWSLLQNERNQSLWDYYCHLMQLRKSNPALYSDHFEVIANMPDRGIIAYKRWDEKDNIVVVLANLMPHYAGKVEIRSMGIEDGQWREAIYNYEISVQQNCLSDTLAESEVKIYVKC